VNTLQIYYKLFVIEPQQSTYCQIYIYSRDTTLVRRSFLVRHNFSEGGLCWVLLLFPAPQGIVIVGISPKANDAAISLRLAIGVGRVAALEPLVGKNAKVLEINKTVAIQVSS